ncbi:MAG: DUF3422 domain-containing protein [Vannielia sp.]|uniref:DUF3422 family protein n=1 Tax=Rhodobacterales TaxID=204455 RepID=UPI002095259F|nr:DUF3422 domain-containing protein [Oceanicola sp. 502str15]MCO6382527.1 DUF3422 family protein [Oceanicola sp. 502str15]
MAEINDHPLRYQLANELHARPFPALEVPCRAAYLALKPAEGAAGRDREAERAHLIDLLDRHGAPHPQPDATHYSGQLGRHQIKWESHTEFVTYTIFGPGVADTPFDAATFGMFPEDWLARAPGVRVTSALVRVEPMPDSPETASKKLDSWMVAESIAVSEVVDGDVIVGTDFRIDPRGHVRFGCFVKPGVGPQRVGRVVQRLTEIETYKAMSMLGLGRARRLSGPLSQLDDELSELMAAMTGERARPAEAELEKLLKVAVEIETLLTHASFRFGATQAYEAIVWQRIEVLREQRFLGRQTLKEFMTRRYDPAMRTVKSTEGRLQAMAARSARASDLLRTRVDVERQAQNQALLASMDKRADLQLRLQQTVEGLSVVAISYYAVSLGTYMLEPFAKSAGIEKGWLTAGLTPVVIALVWLAVRRIRKRLH